MVGENSAADPEAWRNENFEWVALYSTGDRGEYRKAGSPIVRCWRKHNRRPSPGLLVTCLWVKREPNQVAALGSVRPLTRFRCQPDSQFLFCYGDFAE